MIGPHMNIQARVISCDHSCGGKPVKYATPGVTGFICTKCGAEVVDLGPTIGSANQPKPSGVRRQYF